MRATVLVLAVSACTPIADRYSLTAEERARFGGTSPHAPPRASDQPPPEQPKTASVPSPPQETPEAPEARCERTRQQRIAQAKDAITSFDARMKEITPLVKFWFAHKCELRDTTGTVLVKRTKEAGGTRISVQRGHADEVVCNTANIPPELDSEAARYIVLLDSIAEDDIMFSTYPECDAKERPSLLVRYNDKKAQAAILALP